MILDEIKDLIKELETILVKDKRFKECIDFKNQVKIIYNCENNLNKNFPIPQFTSVDVTPLLSNLTLLGKTTDLTKTSSSDGFTTEDCEKVISELKLSIKKLLDEIDRLYYSAHGAIGMDPKFDAEIEAIKKLLIK